MRHSPVELNAPVGRYLLEAVTASGYTFSQRAGSVATQKNMLLNLSHYRELLLQRRAVLQQVVQAGDDAAATVELDQTRVGRRSRMDALQGQAMSQETQRRRERELRHISAALQRIEHNEFGECTQCGEMIAEGRLAIDPAATLCIVCAEKQ